MNQFELLGLHDPEPGSAVPDAAIASTLPSVAARSRGPVFATAAERGVWVCAPGEGAAPPERIAAVDVEEPVDPTGAGDSFTAGAVLSLAAGAALAEAALVGNLVASITVKRLGETGVARSEELYPALQQWLERNR
jgi:sugar/nucleoside kinase (ribokinase family)